MEDAFRFFIRYSRQEPDKAKIIDDILTSQGFFNLWDQSLDPGHGFIKQIQLFSYRSKPFKLKSVFAAHRNRYERIVST